MSRTKAISWFAAAAAVLVLGPFRAKAQDMQSCPAHKDHAAHADSPDHAAGVDARGNAVMGFDHDKTTHHFRLTPDGGSIEVTANANDDAASVDAIRGHLPHIARMFSEGNFQAPMIVHGRVPPGVSVMQSRKRSILWTYEKLPAGGRVVASTRDRKALGAIHEFLRFQIADHRTGDSEMVGEPGSGGKRPTS